MLLKQPDVIRVNEAIERLEKKGPSGVRRHLLATSVRLSRTMAPDVHRTCDHCIDKLGIDIPLELYVYSSPQFNAACIKPEEGRLFIMLSSSLLESFKGSELRFVMGHELGHHLYHHHDIPVGHLLRGAVRPSPRLALQLFAWSRYAEISADRAGAHCADEFFGVSRSLFRLASGLGDDVIHFDLDEFIGQVDDLTISSGEPGQGAPQEDWFSTHPFSPVRVKALKLYHDSVFVKPDGISVDELELKVQSVMGLMEPSYLEAKTESGETMRRLLFAGALAIARANEEISSAEEAVFEEFFGKGAIGDNLNFDRIMRDLPERIRLARENLSESQRMQVLRDLCLMLKADTRDDAAEREIIYDIAEALNISPLFIDAQLALSVELD
ncbi:MAG: hypothetical protein DHS20C01_26520 [marine bacterium B5-7]|nr:MAG: hypothetical protein DHS20C01_26520 [marine bacterium B5-7]